MAKKPKKPKTKEQVLQGFIIPKLRNIARMWPEKNKARARAARKVKVGVFKNGKDELRTMFECSACKEVFPKEETQMDHTEPVVEVSGFVDWNTYISRLFCDANGYTCMCKSCHLIKSLSENDERREIKKKKS